MMEQIQMTLGIKMSLLLHTPLNEYLRDGILWTISEGVLYTIAEDRIFRRLNNQLFTQFFNSLESIRWNQ